MRKPLIVVCAALAFAVTASATTVDPATALSEAKGHINAGSYAKAAAALEPAIAASDAIADPSERRQAATALHFYMAVALSGMRRSEEALSHLEEAFRLTPGMHAVDTRRYTPEFVAVFERARSEVVGAGRFEELYPGFSSSVATTSAKAVAGPEPAIEYLGSTADKRAWRDAATPEAKARLLVDFWRARNLSPDAEPNELRDAFTRRVAFADQVFALPAQRGAMTDRGRIFTVLGTPALVRRRALTAADQVQPISRGGIGIEVGTVEYWFYTREQFPFAIAQPTVTFRFVSHQGLGAFVLQKDGVAMNALATASKAPVRR